MLGFLLEGTKTTLLSFLFFTFSVSFMRENTEENTIQLKALENKIY